MAKARTTRPKITTHKNLVDSRNLELTPVDAEIQLIKRDNRDEATWLYSKWKRGGSSTERVVEALHADGDKGPGIPEIL